MTDLQLEDLLEPEKKKFKRQPLYVDPPKDGKAEFHTIPSFSNPETIYDIRVMPDGEVRCSCIANVMGWNCKHIKTFIARHYPPKRTPIEEPIIEPKEPDGFGAEIPF